MTNTVVETILLVRSLVAVKTGKRTRKISDKMLMNAKKVRTTAIQMLTAQIQKADSNANASQASLVTVLIAMMPMNACLVITTAAKIRSALISPAVIAVNVSLAMLVTVLPASMSMSVRQVFHLVISGPFVIIHLDHSIAHANRVLK